MSHTNDTKMMARALQLARKGMYWAAPNPYVGCVLVKDGHIIGEGFTQPAGGNHAEIQALQSTANAAGSTAYVTLEPCCHTGKTGPCSRALIDAGVGRVVVAMQDPNPQVAGSGLAQLRDAGIEVSCGLLEDEARRTIIGFSNRMVRGRGRVRAKLAMSLDGRTAMASGESQWITGAAARADVQRLRAMSCAIVTGVGTVLADDCALTVRQDQLELSQEYAYGAQCRQPVRVVVDSRLQTPAQAKVLSAGAETILFHEAGGAVPSSLKATDAIFSELPAGAGGLNLRPIFDILNARHCNEILVESGPRLAGALLRLGLLDEIVVYMAPTLMGSNARPLFDLPLDIMAQQLPLEIEDVRRVGRDWRLTAVPNKE